MFFWRLRAACDTLKTFVLPFLKGIMETMAKTVQRIYTYFMTHHQFMELLKAVVSECNDLSFIAKQKALQSWTVL